MRDQSVKPCRKCGRPVSVITCGVYRKILVDADAVDVVPDAHGEEFVRIDGSKVRGKEIDPENAFALTRGTSKNLVEYAYRPHVRTCGVEK